MGLSVLSHLKVASAEVSAWHMAAERNQSMQWSPRLSAAANFQRRYVPTNVNLKMLSIMSRHVWVIVLSVTPLAEHFLSFVITLPQWGAVRCH